ncbi:MAG: hypothetical protein ACR2OZ_14285 [Verrucomicrobiales bacterium]
MSDRGKTSEFPIEDDWVVIPEFNAIGTFDRSGAAATASFRDEGIGISKDVSIVVFQVRGIVANQQPPKALS